MDQPRTQEQGSIPPGTWVDHFRVKRLLGRGGMGEVYLARDTRLGRQVALKVIHLRHLGRPLTLERFLFEARATARFSHPHIVGIYSVGEWEGSPYLALEYLEGQTLRGRLSEGHLSPAQAARVGLAIAQALAEAHAHQVLHRDLKPENVILARDGRLRVLDFGLAKALLAPEPRGAPAVTEEGDTPPAVRSPSQPLVVASLPTASAMESAALQPSVPDLPPLHGGASPALPTAGPSPEDTASQEIFRTDGAKIRGTPAYLAPELWLQRPVTTAADLWSFGVLLYEAVTGQRPFPGKDPFQLALTVSSPRVTPDPGPLQDLPAPLAELIEGCLRADPAQRPSAAQAVEALGALVQRSRGEIGAEAAPFRGLLPFDERHAGLFFGRSADVDGLVERLRSEVFLPLVGPSGAGKSSLVAAGVVPRLRDQGRWEVITLRPGARPFEQLAARLVQRSSRLSPTTGGSGPDAERVSVGDSFDGVEGLLKGEWKPPASEQRLVDELRQHPARLAVHLGQIAELSGTRILLFVDQLEELYTLAERAEERRAFLEAICLAADDPEDPVRVVVTLRDDFLGRVVTGDAALRAFSRVAVVRSPGPEALAEIVAGPVEAMGYRFEDGDLVKEMVAEVKGEPACLPLLQFACHALWARRDEGRRMISREAYAAVGGVAGALVQQAEGVLEGLTPSQIGLAREVLLRLVTPESTRRVVPLPELLDGLDGAAQDVLDRLIRERLLSIHRGRRGPSVQVSVELAHEALVTRWGRLGRWLEESREDRVFLEEALQAAQLWDRRGRREEEVWEGTALDDARRALERCTAPVPPLLAAFFEAAEGRDARGRRRRRWARVGGVLALVIFALAATAVALVVRGQREEARTQRNRAQQARRAAEEKRAEAERESARAALVRSEVQEARARLRSSLERLDAGPSRVLWWRLTREPRRWRRVLDGTVTDGRLSPDGARLAVVSTMSNLVVTDLEGFVLRAFDLAGAAPGAVCWSQDGRAIFVGTERGEIWQYDYSSGRLARRLAAHAGKIYGLDVEPRSGRLASGGQDGAVRLWDTATGARIGELSGGGASIARLRFGPRGRWLAATSVDGVLRLWSQPEGRLVHRFAEGRRLSGLAFSPAGDWLAVGARSGQVTIRRLPTGALEARVQAGQAQVNGLATARGGRDLYIAAGDGRVWRHRLGDPGAPSLFDQSGGNLWWLASGPRLDALVGGGTERVVTRWRTPATPRPLAGPGHTSPVLGLAWSPDGRYLTSAGEADSIARWDLQLGGVVRRVAVAPRSHRLLASGPAGRYLLVGGSRNGIAVLGSRLLNRLGQLDGHVGVPMDVAVARNGQLAASTGADFTVRLWDPVARRLIRTIATGTLTTWGVALSPDARLVSAAASDGKVRVWEVATGKRLHAVSYGPASIAWGLAFHPGGRWLATSSRAGHLDLWDVATWKPVWRQRLPMGVNRIAFRPDGAELAVSTLRGARVVETQTGRTLRRLWHFDAEVNATQFSRDGRLIATAADDYTVRLWDAASVRPLWRAPALLTGPARLLTHRGWHDLAGGLAAARPPRTPVERHLATQAALADAAPTGGGLCVATWDDHLERWTGGALTWRVPLADLRALRATPAGCLVLAGGKARLVTATAPGAVTPPRPGPSIAQAGLSASTREAVLAEDALAIALDGEGLLVATRSGVIRLDARGRHPQRLTEQRDVTALHRNADFLLLGTRNGTLRALARGGDGGSVAAFGFEQLPRAAVTRILSGPGQTVLAGFADGTVGLWDRRTGRRLERFRLHGPIAHLRLTQRLLVAATELGDLRVFDVAAFSAPYCALLREVWKDVPVIWENGGPVRAAPPADHPCRR